MGEAAQVPGVSIALPRLRRCVGTLATARRDLGAARCPA